MSNKHIHYFHRNICIKIIHILNITYIFILYNQYHKSLLNHFYLIYSNHQLHHNDSLVNLSVKDFQTTYIKHVSNKIIFDPLQLLRVKIDLKILSIGYLKIDHKILSIGYLCNISSNLLNKISYVLISHDR